MSNRSDTISSLFMAPPSALSADNKPAEAPRRVAAGSVRSLQNTFSDVERENAELRQRLDAGEVIVEIDPADIAPSPFRVAGNAPVPSGGAHRCRPDHSPRQPEWEALRPQGQGCRDRARSCGGEETGSGVAAWDGARNALAPACKCWCWIEPIPSRTWRGSMCCPSSQRFSGTPRLYANGDDGGVVVNGGWIFTEIATKPPRLWRTGCSER